MSGPRTAVAALAVLLVLGVTPALADDADIGGLLRCPRLA